MSTSGRSQSDEDLLSIELGPAETSVSYLSSLLRVVQAALREVARGSDELRPLFDRTAQPMLVVSRVRANGGLRLFLTFTDPGESRPMGDLSARTFDAFLDNLGAFVKELPQPSLWGGASRRRAPRSNQSALAIRMDQVYQELRRSPRATLGFRGRTIEIEGDRMVIS